MLDYTEGPTRIVPAVWRRPDPPFLACALVCWSVQFMGYGGSATAAGEMDLDQPSSCLMGSMQALEAGIPGQKVRRETKGRAVFVGFPCRVRGPLLLSLCDLLGCGGIRACPAMRAFWGD
jgi:hypothetical protein